MPQLIGVPYSVEGSVNTQAPPRQAFMVFVPYIILLTLCGAFIGLAVTLDNYQAKALLIGASIVAAVCTVFFAGIEVDHFDRQWKLHEKKELSALPQPPPQPIQILQQIAGPDGTQKLLRTDLPDRPDRDFITWVFLWAGEHDQAAPTEAMSADYFRGRFSSVQTNLWLTLLEQARVIEKTGDYPNAPRRVVAGMTAEAARKRFGYED